jgi:hypothetical protein
VLVEVITDKKVVAIAKPVANREVPKSSGSVVSSTITNKTNGNDDNDNDNATNKNQQEW